MVKRDLEKERQMELAAIWGSEVDGENRYPQRRRKASKRPDGLSTGSSAYVDESGDVISDLGSDAISEDRMSDRAKSKKLKSKKGKKNPNTYRLHCFIGPGVERNAVRTVFEAYEPKVEIRVSQQGNLLNKTHYAVLTFRNKAMALHSVKMLDGTDQRDLLGVKELKLRLMLSRKEHNLVRHKLRKRLREEQEKRMEQSINEEVGFIKSFVEAYGPKLTK